MGIMAVSLEPLQVKLEPNPAQGWIQVLYQIRPKSGAPTNAKRSIDLSDAVPLVHGSEPLQARENIIIGYNLDSIGCNGGLITIELPKQLLQVSLETNLVQSYYLFVHCLLCFLRTCLERV
ncbi:hypothetical protein MUK42_25927 [Musa troglodytarum]|uniref:Uncharacterized protein n=1 Tax=Musa troglodytarum TaxID=320322 RepID=A0A9E7E8X9_9LILI|nr:hypothetical protein MUK42_25927 [Musa troglodytarum]